MSSHVLVLTGSSGRWRVARGAVTAGRRSAVNGFTNVDGGVDVAPAFGGAGGSAVNLDCAEHVDLGVGEVGFKRKFAETLGDRIAAVGWRGDVPDGRAREHVQLEIATLDGSAQVGEGLSWFYAEVAA